MTVFRILTLSGLIAAATLTGCASGEHGAAQQPSQASQTVYRPSGGDYMPNYRISTSLGPVMTTPEGATVYTFDKDQAGLSSCYADCARNWPPVIAKDGALPYGRMSLSDRSDGQRQWAYDGKPLYTFAADRMHGDVKGDNAGEVWHVVK
jgi:predicted lipoprotein with Yx(FWY)xxD motif